MAKYSGWEAVGYGMGGGFEKDRTEREKIQNLDAAKAGLKYNPETNDYAPAQGSNLELLAQQNTMLTNQLKQVETSLTTSKQWDSIVDSVQTNNYDSFNKLLNEDQKLKTIFKDKQGVHAIRQFDITNPAHINAMGNAGINTDVMEHIQKGIATPEEITQIGNAYPIIEKQDGTFEAASLDTFLASTNLTRSSTKSSEQKLVFDAIAQGRNALTGITDRAYKANMTSIEAKANLEKSTSERQVNSNTIMTKAANTGDTAKVMEALQLTQPELFLKLQQSGSQRMDSYTQSMTAFIASNPNATEAEWKDFNGKWAEKSVAGVGEVAKDLSLGNLKANREKSRNLFSQDSANVDYKTWTTDARTTQDAILSDLDEKEKSKVMDIDKELKANHNTATIVEGMLKGTVPKIDKDAVRNTIDWVNKFTGNESAQTLENIDFNTQSGMLLASYIKEMSGTAASDPEVQRLLTNLLGGNLTDEVYIKQSMKAFSNYLRTKNNTTATSYKDTLPYTVGTTTNLRPKSNEQGKRPSLSSFSGSTKALDRLSLDSFNKAK